MSRKSLNGNRYRVDGGDLGVRSSDGGVVLRAAASHVRSPDHRIAARGRRPAAARSALGVVFRRSGAAGGHLLAHESDDAAARGGVRGVEVGRGPGDRGSGAGVGAAAPRPVSAGCGVDRGRRVALCPCSARGPMEPAVAEHLVVGAHAGSIGADGSGNHPYRASHLAGERYSRRLRPGISPLPRRGSPAHRAEAPAGCSSR